MRKWMSIILLLLGILILSGCGKPEEEMRDKIKETESSLETQMKQAITALSTDKEIGKYLTDVKFEKDTGSDELNFFYVITGSLADSFDSLSEKEQHTFFQKISDTLREKYKDSSGDLDCDSEYDCRIWKLEFPTSLERYTMYYDSFRDIPVTFEDSSGKEYDGTENIKVEEDAEVAEETVAPENTDALASEEETEIAEVYSDINMDPSSANGNDWMQMDDALKVEMTSTIISTLESRGYTILESELWFIDALDAFYGDEATNSTTVLEIMALSGVGGGVIIKP